LKSEEVFHKLSILSIVKMSRKCLFIVLLTIAIVAVILGATLYFVLRNTDHSGAVITSTEECTQVAVDVLKRGGSAVDSAISACLCTGITSPQQSGLGGGVIATVFIKETGSIETINAREVAPSGARFDMFDNENDSVYGGLAVAVPTELKGLFELHQRYGKLPWHELVEPVALIAENGFKVSRYLRIVFESRGERIRNNKVLR
jgi:gamma-glutamyltranspeptidase/glutathione hydrolase/leukotriene-C4 hydrolase